MEFVLLLLNLALKRVYREHGLSCHAIHDAEIETLGSDIAIVRLNNCADVFIAPFNGLWKGYACITNEQAEEFAQAYEVTPEMVRGQQETLAELHALNQNNPFRPIER